MWHNSSPPSATYMRQWTGSSLLQVMVCCLFGAKPLPEPMLAYCQFDSLECISVEFEWEFYHFHSRKCIWIYRLQNGSHLVQGGWVNILCHWMTLLLLQCFFFIIMLSMSNSSRADFRFLPSQWEMALLCYDTSHWLGASLESALSGQSYTSVLD